MPISQEQKRKNLRLVLLALKKMEGSVGGSTAGPIFNDYCRSEAGAVAADTAEFTFLSMLKLTRFYVDPTSPDKAEKERLWDELKKTMKKTGDVPSMSGRTLVGTLQEKIEDAPDAEAGE